MLSLAVFPFWCACCQHTAAGVGRPKLVHQLVVVDGQPFARVMAAVRSNMTGEGGDGRISLVLERAGGASESGADEQAGGTSLSSGAGQPLPEGEGGVFDQEIFE